MVRPSSSRDFGQPQLIRLLPSPRIQRRQQFLLSDPSLRQHGGNRLVQQMCQANFVRNFDGRVFESVRVPQVTALFCRQSHTTIYFANSFTLPFATPCEPAGANSLHYTTTYLPNTRFLGPTLSGSFLTRKNLFWFFSRARNHLKIGPQVIDSKPLD